MNAHFVEKESLGKLAFVLHAHLPYVRSTKPGSLEEDLISIAKEKTFITTKKY